MLSAAVLVSLPLATACLTCSRDCCNFCVFITQQGGFEWIGCSSPLYVSHCSAAIVVLSRGERNSSRGRSGLSLAAALQTLIMEDYEKFNGIVSRPNATRRDAMSCGGHIVREVASTTAEACAAAKVDGRRPEYIFPRRPHEAGR